MNPNQNQQQPSANTPDSVPPEQNEELSSAEGTEVTTPPSQAGGTSGFNNHLNIAPIHSDIKPSDIHLPVAPPVQPQAAVRSPQPASPTLSVPLSTDNPGKTTGILSIVFMFVFPILGIVFGAMSRSKSNAANMPTKLGSIGLVGSIITTLLSIISGVLFVVLVVNAGNALVSQESISGSSKEPVASKDKELVAQANRLAKLAEAYYAINGDYPKTLRDFLAHPESKIPEDIKLSGNVVTGSSVAYGYCGVGAAQVAYRSSAEEGASGQIFSGEVVITALGSASSSQPCSSLNVDYKP